MHKYLKSIGLKSLDSKRKVREFLRQIIKNPDTTNIVWNRKENTAVLTKKLTDKAGIAICGEYEDQQEFRMDSYFPYVISDEISAYTRCTFSRKSNSDDYFGFCDDYRLEVALIFFLTNSISLFDEDGEQRMIDHINLSALAEEGKIILPVRKTQMEINAAQFASVSRGNTIAWASRGNTEAIEKLALEDMSLYNAVSRRITKEDLYSVIDSYFMPTGVECDQYSVMGDITEVESWTNEKTGEEGYYLMIDCNEMPILVSIHKDDLLGEPAEGRRFKGKVWMQGTAIFFVNDEEDEDNEDNEDDEEE